MPTLNTVAIPSPQVERAEAASSSSSNSPGRSSAVSRVLGHGDLLHLILQFAGLHRREHIRSLPRVSLFFRKISRRDNLWTRIHCDRSQDIEHLFKHHDITHIKHLSLDAALLGPVASSLPALGARLEHDFLSGAAPLLQIVEFPHALQMVLTLRDLRELLEGLDRITSPSNMLTVGQFEVLETYPPRQPEPMAPPRPPQRQVNLVIPPSCLCRILMAYRDGEIEFLYTWLTVHAKTKFSINGVDPATPCASPLHRGPSNIPERLAVTSTIPVRLAVTDQLRLVSSASKPSQKVSGCHILFLLLILSLFSRETVYRLLGLCGGL